MENKKVGLIIMGIAILMAVIVVIFNFTLKQITSQSCSMWTSCSMYTSITIQTWISLSITAIILIIGIVMFFSKPKEKIVIKIKKEKKKKLDLSKLDKNEQELIEILHKENEAIFHNTLMEK